MTVTATTTNLLWARARSLCSKCKRDLAPLIRGQATLAGFQAHITSSSAGGPRYDSALASKQRDDYTNLILLCGSCHAEVDKLQDHFTVALLHAIKAEHERECADRLTLDDEVRAIRGEVLASAVDLVVEGLCLERWDEWTAEILNTAQYRWPKWALGAYRHDVRPAVESVLWPDDATSLEVSSKMAVDAAIALYQTFGQQSGYEDRDYTVLVCESLERALSRCRSTDHQRELMHWDETLELGLVHLTKCVNWFGDAVREHVAPRFRIRPGSFRAEPSKFQRDSHGVYRFTSDEKTRLVGHGYAQPREYTPWRLVDESWSEPPKREYPSADSPEL